MIVEWNAHMFSRDTQRYPFHPAAAYVPDAAALEKDPLTSYLKRMERLGIDRAVLVHPEPYGDDHRLILDCLGRESRRLRGVCHFFPKDPFAAEKLGASPRNVAAVRSFIGKKLSIRSSCRVTSCGVPSVAITVNRLSSTSPLRSLK